MKKNNFAIAVLTVLTFTLYITSCSNPNSGKDNTTVNVTSNQTKTERGKYLVTVMGCHDCHSPKKTTASGADIIPELMLSGFPADRARVKFDNKMIKDGFSIFYPDLTGSAGPWGVSYASNLTPDVSGLEGWTEEQLKKALTEGKFNGLDNVRMLLPPMPWQNFTKLTDDDLNAIFIYLQSIKPVSNMVPAPVPPDNM